MLPFWELQHIFARHHQSKGVRTNDGMLIPALTIKMELSPSLIGETISITTKIATLLPTGSHAKRRHILDVLNVKVQLQESNTAEYAIWISCYLKKEPMLIELRVLQTKLLNSPNFFSTVIQLA